MNANKPNTANTIRIKLEATLPLPEVQPAKSPCSTGCGGTCGQHKSSGAEKTDPSASLRMTGPSGAVPPKPPCGNCGACGAAGEDSGNALRIAGETLIKVLIGQYAPEQIPSAMEVIAAAMRRHYSRQP